MYLCLKSNSLIGKKSVLFSGRSYKTENAGFTIMSVKYHENQVDFLSDQIDILLLLHQLSYDFSNINNNHLFQLQNEIY